VRDAVQTLHNLGTADIPLATQQTPVVIETRELRKTDYGKVAVPALHGIDLRIQAGEFVAIAVSMILCLH
jgi:hypothetical protein